MRAATDRMSKQNTAPSQSDDVAASHMPCPSEPKIVPIASKVEKGNRAGICVINPLVPWLVVCHSRLRRVAERAGRRPMLIRSQGGIADWVHRS